MEAILTLFALVIIACDVVLSIASSGDPEGRSQHTLIKFIVCICIALFGLVITWVQKYGWTYGLSILLVASVASYLTFIQAMNIGHRYD